MTNVYLARIFTVMALAALIFVSGAPASASTEVASVTIPMPSNITCDGHEHQLTTGPAGGDILVIGAEVVTGVLDPNTTYIPELYLCARPEWIPDCGRRPAWVSPARDISERRRIFGPHWPELNVDRELHRWWADGSRFDNLRHATLTLTVAALQPRVCQ